MDFWFTLAFSVFYAAIFAAIVWFIWRRNPRVYLYAALAFVVFSAAGTLMFYTGEPEFSGGSSDGDLPVVSPPAR